MSDRQSVTHVYFLEIPRKNTEKFLENWEKEEPSLKRTRGLMDIKLFSETSGLKMDEPSKWSILAEWRSKEDFESALSKEEFSSFFREWEVEIGEQKFTLVKEANAKETKENKPSKVSVLPGSFSTNALSVIIWVFGIILAFLILALR